MENELPELSFVKLVWLMRETQKRFFANRQSHDMREAKKLEKEVDERLNKMLGKTPYDQQQKLF